MIDTLWELYYTIKYFAQGDSWKEAKVFAHYIVRGFK
jgi:hypothetical protein